MGNGLANGFLTQYPRHSEEESAMKVYRGVVKGNTIVLEEKPDLPDECQALVEIKPLDRTRDEEIAQRQIELMRKAPRVGKLLYKKRDELYER